MDTLIKPDILQEVRKKTLFDINTPDNEEHVCLSISTNDNTSIISTLGNLSLITGKAKSRKTFLVSGIIAAVLTNDTVLNFTGCLPDDKRKVILFDTEQGKKDSKKVYKRILNTAGLNDTQNNDNFEYHRLRPFTTKERLTYIETIIYGTKNIGFVVIDGVKDLINSINDEKEATIIGSKLLKWTEDLNIHISVVLHQNKTDNQTRGHVGTELMNKAETVVTIRKDLDKPEYSIIESDLMRDLDFEPFIMGIDENGLPYFVDYINASLKKGEASKKEFVFSLDLYQIHYLQILKPAFEKNNTLNYNEFQEAIKENFKTIQKIGNNVARNLMPFYVQKNLVVKSGRNYVINSNYKNILFKDDETV